MAFGMQSVQFQSQAPSDPHETVSIALCHPRPVPQDSRQKPLLPQMLQGPMEQLPHRCRGPQRRGDPDTPKAVQMSDQYVA